MPAYLYEAVKNKLPKEGRDAAELEKFEKDRATLVAMLKGEIPQEHSIPISEAIYSHDYLTIYGKAVEDMVGKPTEPVMIGQDLFVTRISMPGAYSNMIIRLPALAMITPIELGQGMEYPEGSHTSGAASTSISIKKFGAKVSIADEVIAQSQWPIVGAYLEAIGLAMVRMKEQKIFEAVENTAHVVFDNSIGFGPSFTFVGGPDDESAVTNKDFITHGCNVLVKYNGTISLFDLIDMQVALLNNGYQATDIVMHPMAWMILAKDPILRNFALMTGAIGNMPWMRIGPDAQGPNMPFGLALNMTPFVAFDKTTKPYKTSVYVGCRNKTIALIQGDGPVQESWRDPAKDMEAVKVKEFYGINLLDYGRGWTVAKNVFVDVNHFTGEVAATVQLTRA